MKQSVGKEKMMNKAEIETIKVFVQFFNYCFVRYESWTVSLQFWCSSMLLYLCYAPVIVMLCCCYCFIMLLLYFYRNEIITLILFFILRYLYGSTDDYVTKDLLMRPLFAQTSVNTLKNSQRCIYPNMADGSTRS